MNVVPLSVDAISDVKNLLAMGKPYIGLRTDSDYWAYATLFSSTCPVMLNDDGEVIGVVVAFRSQDDPADVYVQDVMIHPDYRGRGLVGELIGQVAAVGSAWGCDRIYLTSEPDNTAAAFAWHKLGFANVPGDFTEHGVQVIRDFKGSGRHRAVYELILRSGD